ncbi:MAG: hypothetical protein AAFQ83_09370 [Bacteroidota bacterium]
MPELIPATIDQCSYLSDLPHNKLQSVMPQIFDAFRAFMNGAFDDSRNLQSWVNELEEDVLPDLLDTDYERDLFEVLDVAKGVLTIQRTIGFSVSCFPVA